VRTAVLQKHASSGESYEDICNSIANRAEFLLKVSVDSSHHHSTDNEGGGDSFGAVNSSSGGGGGGGNEVNSGDGGELPGISIHDITSQSNQVESAQTSTSTSSMMNNEVETPVGVPTVTMLQAGNKVLNDT
jgi:hypothetical protein